MKTTADSVAAVRTLQPTRPILVPPGFFSFVYRFISVLNRAPDDFFFALKELIETINWDLKDPKGAILGKSICGADDAAEACMFVKRATNAIGDLTEPWRIEAELEQRKQEAAKLEEKQRLDALFEKVKDTWFHAEITTPRFERLPEAGTLKFRQKRDADHQISEKDARMFEFAYDIRKRSAKKPGEADTYFLHLHNDHVDQTIACKQKPTKRAGLFKRAFLCPKCKDQVWFLKMYIDDPGNGFLCETCSPPRYLAIMPDDFAARRGGLWGKHYVRMMQPRFIPTGGTR